jgi:tetratricopeptide (TPR) repeat protein
MSTYLSERMTSAKDPIFYYLSTANADYKENRESIRSLNTKLEVIESEQLFYAFNDFESQSHHSLVATSIPKAIQHIFEIYAPISTSEYKESILPLGPSDVVDYLKKKYATIEDIFGVEKQILLSDFRAISSAINQKESFKEFKDMAELARKHYPESLLANLYLGWYYEGAGSIRKAIKIYQEAFVFDEIDGIRKEDLLYRAEQLKAESED